MTKLFFFMFDKHKNNVAVFADFEQVKKNCSFANFGQVKKYCHFADFVQVKEILSFF